MIASNNKDKLAKVKSELEKEFEMKNLGPGKRILGIEIGKHIKMKVLLVSQESYLR